MTRLNDSTVPLDVLTPQVPAPTADRSIGDIIAELRQLSAEQVEKILRHQREHGLRFGEAAVALGLAQPDDVLRALARQFHYPVADAGQHPVGADLVMLREPYSPRAEAFRSLRSQVAMRVFDGGAERRALAVIGTDPGDGRSYCAANLAVSLAQLGGGRTLLVDADLRQPRQHQVFGLPNTGGLSAWLSGRPAGQVVQPVPGVPGLFVLPAGTTPPNPLELVERPAFAALLRDLAAQFDHVVVDTPAAGHGADASVIAARCGAALLVVRRGHTRMAHAQQLLDSFSGGGVRMAGAVFNEH